MIALKSHLKKLILGFDLPQEYLCVGKEELLHPLKVFLGDETSSQPKDVSDQHLFLGYKPLVIGIPALNNSNFYKTLEARSIISLQFLAENEKTKMIAELKLKFIQRKVVRDYTVFLYEGVNGNHQLLSPFYQMTNGILNKSKEQKVGNINLDGNLYEQVRIAYSVPRLISIVSLGDGKQFNMFPTDLNGPVGDGQYVISLRHDGKANAQVEEFGKICIATVGTSFFKTAYGMGRNHMQSLRSLENFEVADERSEKFNLPLSSQILTYRELERMDSIDVGIHRLHFFNVVHRKILRSDASLAHVHRYFASWDIKQGHGTHYLIR